MNIKKIKKIIQKIKIKKVSIGKVEHYYAKAQVGLFIIENQGIKLGDTILISGPTTGIETLQIDKMFVNGTENSVATMGDKVTMHLPFRVRLSDKIFKVLN